MRLRILLVFVLMTLAFPVFTETVNTKETRRVKVSVQAGWGESPLLVHQNSDALTLNFNTGKTFNQAFWSRFLPEYVYAKPGVTAGGLIMGPRANARAVVWTSNPSAFSVGDVFPLYQERFANSITDGWPLSLEVRPRIGGMNSRWRLGFGVSQSRAVRVAGIATSDQVNVEGIAIQPHSPNEVFLELDLSRTYHRQTFDSEVTLYTLSAGPEFDIIQSRLVDLSLEGGAMAFIYARGDHRTEVDERYTLFSPEYFAPDTDPAQLRKVEAKRGGAKDRMGGGRQYVELQTYLGARLELYPVHWAGIGAQLRWYALDAPLTNTYYPMFGSYDVNYEASHWTTNFYVTFALSKSRSERR